MGEKTEKHEKKNKKVIYENVRKQLEFYFSDAALSKDRFLNKLIEADPLGFVSLDVFLTFNKIKNFTDKLSDLVKAISSSAVLILNDDHTKVLP